MRKTVTAALAAAAALAALTGCTTTPTNNNDRTVDFPKINLPKIDLPRNLPTSLPTSDTPNSGETIPGDTDALLVARAQIALPNIPTVNDNYPRIDGYDRSCKTGAGCSFGPAWNDNNNIPETGHNGCDTRNDVLWQQLEDATRRANSKCVVESGRYIEPYFGTVEKFERGEDISGQEEVDHVIALRTAWDLGASTWTPEKRADFANDTELNLLVTTRAANSAGMPGRNPGKSDRTASEWLPHLTDPARACNFAARYALVAAKYDLPVTKSDSEAISSAFANC